MIKIDARGDACPLPVVKAKKAIAELHGPGEVEVLVDNEIAVQNLTKMAQQKGYLSSSEKAGRAGIPVFALPSRTQPVAETAVPGEEKQQAEVRNLHPGCPHRYSGGHRRPTRWARAAEELGKTLLKAFVFSLTQQDKLPKTILFYNGGAQSLTCEGSPMLEDLKALEAEGVEILTCGTCLNFYGLTEKLAVGGVTNMYVIAEKMLNAGNVVKP